MLKIALYEDMPDMLRMSLLFKDNSPYRDFPLEEDKLEEFIRSIMQMSPDKGIMLLSIVDGKPIGMIAGLAVEFIFSSEKHAAELVWWVDPEYRGDKGRELQEAFISWSKEVGCKYLQMAMEMGEDAEKMTKIYTKQGFKLMEQSWIKEI